MTRRRPSWLHAAGIRALRTVGQTGVSLIGTSAMFDQVHWDVVVSGTLLAGVLSLLTSLASLPEVEPPN